ncbi:MAG: ATP-binding cassette domain-containing protein [Pseudomonadota bacterium]|nr:ATP-binding cassette domain-containing protein [Pseudomonadota bacterium]
MATIVKAEKICLDLPYELQRDERDSKVGFLSSLTLARSNYATVLSNISFIAREGDRVGIMGLNGAGKTTLLKLINGAYLPTSGSLYREGSLQSLLTTTLGFNEYATLAENIILRGTAMGLRYRQVRTAMDDILEFAELEDKASRQLHTLSSGQRMRLGFAISTAIQPDIMLMDEWIGTGDAAFVEKAKLRMMSRFNGSKLSILASHSVGLLQSLCNKALVLDKGRMVYYGDMSGGIEAYQAIVEDAKPDERKLAATSDPLLFGNILGMLERITFSESSVIISGWASSVKKGEVEVISVMTPGGNFIVENFKRINRDDVSAYLGRKGGALGFELALPVSINKQDMAEFVGGIIVRAGMSESSLGDSIPMVSGIVIERI